MNRLIIMLAILGIVSVNAYGEATSYWEKQMARITEFDKMWNTRRAASERRCNEVSFSFVLPGEDGDEVVLPASHDPLTGRPCPYYSQKRMKSLSSWLQKRRDRRDRRRDRRRGKSGYDQQGSIYNDEDILAAKKKTMIDDIAFKRELYEKYEEARLDARIEYMNDNGWDWENKG